MFDPDSTSGLMVLWLQKVSESANRGFAWGILCSVLLMQNKVIIVTVLTVCVYSY